MLTDSIILITSNINAELKEFAKINKLGLSHVDYKVLKVITRITNNITNETYEYEFDELNNETFNRLVLLDQNIFMDQYFEIEIFETEQYFDLLKYSIVATKSKCSIYLIISKNQTVKYVDNFRQLLLEDIKKKMIKSRVLIGLFDVHNNSIEEFIARVRVHEEIKIENDMKILMLKSIEMVKQIDGHIERVYEQKKEEIIDNSINNNRGYVIDTKEDEVLMIYHKAVEGINGRDCKGEIIIPGKAKEHNEFNKKIGVGIKLEDEDGITKIIATKNGYLDISTDEISIKNELEVQSITFRHTGSIESDLDSNIQINVNQSNYLNDAVGAVDIDTKNINIQGNVGHNALIVAETVEISGQVHKSSEIQADDIKIHRLKGVAKGKRITLDILEQGRLKGETIHIKTANGGLIIGSEIYIDEVNGNTIIFASKKIIVGKILGEDNKFIIDPFAMKSSYIIREKIDKLNALEVELKKISIQKHTYVTQMRNQSAPIKEIRKKMEYLKTKNIELPLSMKTLYTKYKDLALLVKGLQQDEFEKKEEMTMIQFYLDTISHDVIDGQIITHNVWSEHNKVIFKISPGKELEYKPKKGEKLESIKIKDRDDGNYVFVLDKELSDE